MRHKFYSLKNILSKDAQYNMIIGERSNGKTYSVKKYGLEQFVKYGKQMAYVRRQNEDFVGKRGNTLFSDIVDNGEVEKLTGGEWTSIHYYSSRWYLCRYEENGDRITDTTPFCFGFSISAMEHDKSTSYPNITTVCFDEFISRTIYLTDEFVLFENVLSTIIRHRTDVKIFMLGNTINKYCPYFKEMGLKHVKQMKQGTIDVYSYGDSGLRVAVEYCAENKQGKDSDVYFAFDNPALSTIKHGGWEISIYPHCPVRYLPKDVMFTYFILFDDDILQCEIVITQDHNFTFIHPKTTEIKHPEKELIYSTEYNSAPNYHRKITKPTTPLEQKIAWYYKTDNVFYSDNETGEIVRNYLLWCTGDM